jgi:hypothetical protein
MYCGQVWYSEDMQNFRIYTSDNPMPQPPQASYRQPFGSKVIFPRGLFNDSECFRIPVRLL